LEYYRRVIQTVILSRRRIKDLAGVPRHIAVKFQDWLEDVEDRGLEEVSRSPGYHHEPLKGNLKGTRSIRLSLHYRAYYKIVDGAVQFVQVERVDKHVY
jgi:toxin HigB-1